MYILIESLNMYIHTFFAYHMYVPMYLQVAPERMTSSLPSESCEHSLSVSETPNHGNTSSSSSSRSESSLCGVVHLLWCASAPSLDHFKTRKHHEAHFNSCSRRRCPPILCLYGQSTSGAIYTSDAVDQHHFVGQNGTLGFLQRGSPSKA